MADLVLATARSYGELIAALRARADELEVSRETIDEVAGLPARYSTKLLGPGALKNLGPMSMGAMLGVLGLKLLVAIDPEARRLNLPKRRSRRHGSAKGVAAAP
jgi:hypothetical protein